MALTPENNSELIDELDVGEDVEIEPSKTWAIDFKNGTIGGFIDESEALRQFVVKALLTERDKYVIYSDEYGTELQDLIGDDTTLDLMNSEIPRMVYETLAYDDRIEDVTDIECMREGDKLFITFTVVPESGASFTEEVEL
ncbi:DUF2634 domain-containing protein [Fictibacillus sp. Mic-4]|uniref:DUF2634 domain-containing protein n=1 Tax=Fictibacillus sp. Mic-4 TaxID=3132826 RepID=UPI003CF2F741